jgi:sugar/nucleoside kinase (ribokinase family)
VIVVIGSLMGRRDQAGHIKPAGFAAALAVAAVRSGSPVQVVARVGDDAVGDEVILGLAVERIGHVATLRDAGRETAVIVDETDESIDAEPHSTDSGERAGPILDAPDVDLALRYLSDYRVIVVLHPADAGVVREAASAATWAGAHLVVVVAHEAPVDVGSMPDSALVVLAQPDAENLAERIGVYAATVESGGDPDTAYAVLTATTT